VSLPLHGSWNITLEASGQVTGRVTGDGIEVRAGTTGAHVRRILLTRR
jgi:hypothetical protein